MHCRIAVVVLAALVVAEAVQDRPVRAGGPTPAANLFLREFGAAGSDDRALDVAVTEDGVYICGLTDGDDYPITAGAYDTHHDGDYDGFVMRLGHGGNIVWSTYLGSPGMDSVTGIDIDESGNVVVCGNTDNPAFPTTAGSLRRQFAGRQEGFVAKLSPDGSTLLASTFVGGAGFDNAARVRCGANATVYVAGSTDSNDFPRVNASQPQLSGPNDAYVLQLDAAGASTTWSTYFGGNSGESVSGLDVGADGAVWITGLTASTSFPTVSPSQPTYGGGFTDTFVARFGPTGAVEFSTYLGGAGIDLSASLAVAPDGRAHVVGSTDAMSFPVTPDAEQPVGAGSFDAYYASFDGTALEHASLLGGPGDDQALGIAANADIIAITGSGGPGFPATASATVKGSSDGFVAYLKPDGERLETRLFGGSGDEVGRSIVLDEGSVAAVAAGTTSTDLVGPPSIGGPKEDSLLLRARALTEDTTERTDLLVDVRPVAKTINGKFTACFEIELRNEGPLAFQGKRVLPVQRDVVALRGDVLHDEDRREPAWRASEHCPERRSRVVHCRAPAERRLSCRGGLRDAVGRLRTR